MQKIYRALIALSLPALAACSTIPQQAYQNRAPESLLDLSAEMVSIRFASAQGMDELVGWLNQEAPTRAELACTDAEPACGQAKAALSQFNVPFDQVQDPRNTASLFYDRVMARDCDSRYVNNSINPYRLNHPSFGCAISANMVQMVADKRQFVNPTLLDLADGEKLVQAYRAYQMPSPVQGESAGDSGSLLSRSNLTE